MKKCFIAAGIVLALAIVTIFLLFLRKPAPLTFPKQEKLTVIQADTMKMPADRFGSEKLSNLIGDMEQAEPLSRFEAWRHKRGDKYYALSFLYDDDTRDIFYFYRPDDEWYLETADGSVYGNAEFITQYTLANEIVASNENPWGIYAAAEISGDSTLISYGIETSYDLRYAIAIRAETYLKNGSSLDEALQQVYDSLRMGYVLYQCAVEEKCDVSEEEYDAHLKEGMEYIKTLENYEDLDRPFKECGTSFEEAFFAKPELGREEYSIELLRQKKREDFRNGQDTINGVAYYTADDYWNGYCWNALEKAETELDFTEFDREFEQAASACKEEFWEA